MSRDTGAPISSSGDDEPPSEPGAHLIQLVRRGRSFSGHERNCVLLNTRQTRWANVSAVSGLDFPDDARAAAQVDWDLDGDLDLWVSNRNSPQVRFLRNDVPNRNRFVALRLEGTRSNRDAIGARVEILLSQPQRAKIIRTLRAGDGYQTQSSKWVHVGLGDASQLDEVSVRWPAGEVERFEGVEVNRHSVLVQGHGQAQPWKLPRSRVHLEPSVTASPPPSQQAATRSVVRLPVPRLPYRDAQGQPHDVLDFQGQPVLLVLWASWCQPCLEELGELSGQHDKINAAGFQVLALCVDELDPRSISDPDAATYILANMQYPYESGVANAELVEKLQLMNDYLFGLQTRLPVPASFLIDEDRRLAAIYRGNLPLDRLMADVESLHVSLEERRDRSVPFAGRWAGEPKTLPLGPFVIDMLKAGFLEDASEYVQRYQDHFGGPAPLLELVVRLGMAYLERGREERAELHFRMARKIDPQTVGPQLTRGRALQAQGKYAEAAAMYREALRHKPSSVQALNNLAWLLATCPDANIRDGQQAVQLASQAVKLTGGSHPQLLDTLAAALAEIAQYDQADKIAARAVALATAEGLVRLASEINQRRQLFQQRQPYRLVQ